jgi:catechol 2,3-dioxygenase-like lactoylglutathione lyase family enzyme/predicted enzyme related to lactoylglutathione lyase
MAKIQLALGLGVLLVGIGGAPLANADTPAEALPPTTAPLLWQPSMNVFRRFAVEPERMFEFYGGVLGFKQLSTFAVGNGGVARFQAGAQQLKLTGQVANRVYRPGGVKAATGLRLISFFFADEAALSRRFTDHGLPAPEFAPLGENGRRTALVSDPDGQAVELVIVPNATPEQLAAIEVGITVADLERSRAFYRSFVGLDELPPVKDARFGTTKYSFRHGATTVSLRSFGPGLPMDNGSGGIQYVVSSVDVVDALAKERHVVVEQPLQGLRGFDLRTLWLNDPDGVTNYFAETGASRKVQGAAAK